MEDYKLLHKGFDLICDSPLIRGMWKMKRHEKRGRSWRRKRHGPSLLRQGIDKAILLNRVPACRCNSFLKDSNSHLQILNSIIWRIGCQLRNFITVMHNFFAVGDHNIDN